MHHAWLRRLRDAGPGRCPRSLAADGHPHRHRGRVVRAGHGPEPDTAAGHPGDRPPHQGDHRGCADLGASPPWDWAISVHDHARRAGVGSDARTVDGPGPADASGGTDAGASGRSGGGHPRRRGPAVGGRSRPHPRLQRPRRRILRTRAELHIPPFPSSCSVPSVARDFCPRSSDSCAPPAAATASSCCMARASFWSASRWRRPSRSPILDRVAGAPDPDRRGAGPLTSQRRRRQ